MIEFESDGSSNEIGREGHVHDDQSDINIPKTKRDMEARMQRFDEFIKAGVKKSEKAEADYLALRTDLDKCRKDVDNAIDKIQIYEKFDAIDKRMNSFEEKFESFKFFLNQQSERNEKTSQNYLAAKEIELKELREFKQFKLQEVTRMKELELKEITRMKELELQEITRMKELELQEMTRMKELELRSKNEELRVRELEINSKIDALRVQKQQADIRESELRREIEENKQNKMTLSSSIGNQSDEVLEVENEHEHATHRNEKGQGHLQFETGKIMIARGKKAPPKNKDTVGGSSAVEKTFIVASASNNSIAGPSRAITASSSSSSINEATGENSDDAENGESSAKDSGVSSPNSSIEGSASPSGGIESGQEKFRNDEQAVDGFDKLNDEFDCPYTHLKGFNPKRLKDVTTSMHPRRFKKGYLICACGIILKPDKQQKFENFPGFGYVCSKCRGFLRRLVAAKLDLTSAQYTALVSQDITRASVIYHNPTNLIDKIKKGLKIEKLRRTK